MGKKVLIVGSGLGALTTAMRMVRKGYEVEIVEKYKQAGGRLNQLKKDGFTFDLAPTFFSMSYEFRNFADECGIQIPFEFVELNPLYSVNFLDQSRNFTIYKDLDLLQQEFEEIEPGFKDKMERYLAYAASAFHDTEKIIIKKNFHSFLHYLMTLTRVPLKHGSKMFVSVWSELNKYFESYEVKVIFSLVAFFLGATPFDTPAVYSMLNYTELKHDGYYNVRGGMYKIVEGLVQLLKKENVVFHYNTEIVDAIESNDTMEALVDQHGECWKADIFVINSDAASFRGKVLNRPAYNPKKLDQKKWTLAPLTLYLGVDGKIPNIEHHNYFLGSNFSDYAANIFKNKVSFEKPYYYVNVPSKENPETAPEGAEAIFILCPVPDLRFKPDWSDREQIADQVIKDFSERINYPISGRLMSKTILDPVQWENMFNLYKGSGLGLAHDMNQVGYFRPRNKDEKMKNVYYVGASTTPGTGLPMVVISSKLVVERIIADDGPVHEK